MVREQLAGKMNFMHLMVVLIFVQVMVAKSEKKSDSCLELGYDYNKPFKQLEKHDIPTLDD